MPGVGYLPTFFLLHHGAFTAFPKNDKCLGEEGWVGGGGGGGMGTLGIE